MKRARTLSKQGSNRVLGVIQGVGLNLVMGAPPCVVFSASSDKLGLSVSPEKEAVSLLG